MKKIELKKTLEERVRDTEWTDANTWNVLRKIRGAKSARSEFSLRRLAPAAVALLLVMGIGIATLTGAPGNPDSIRDKAQYTAQPIVTVMAAGQGEGTGDLPEGEGTEKSYLDALREYYPEVADQLMPVNLSSEKDGIRLEMVSGLVKEYESWMVYSVQDVEGKYAGSELRASCLFEASGAAYGGEMPFLYADEKEHKYYFCDHTTYDEPVSRADRKIPVNMYSFDVNRVVKLDVAKLLDEHGVTSEGVLSPERQPWITAEGPVTPPKVQILDYTKPQLNIPVIGDVVLTGIGWVDGKIHVQLYNPNTHPVTGEMASSETNWYTSVDYNDDYWKEDLYDNARWNENGNEAGVWEEIILNCDREYLEKMNAQVEVTFIDARVDGDWEVKVPLNLVCGDVEPAEEGAENLLDPDAVDTLREFFCSWAGGDMSGMWQKTASEWIMSRNDGEGSLRSLIASGKPLSYQVNGVSGNDGDAERMITCTVEMENPVGEEPMHRQYAVTIRRGEYWYEIDPESFDRWETGNYDPDLDTVSLDEAENATWLISKDCPEMMNDGEILKLSSEKKGITMTVLSGEVREQMASFLCEVYDPEGRYSEFPYDLSWNVDIGTGAEVSAYPVYRSTEAHKVLYKMNVICSEPVTSEDRTVTLGMNSVSVREGAQVDLTEKVKKYAKTEEGVEPLDIALKILQNHHTGPKEVPGLKVLDDTDSLDIPLFGNTCLTGAGWVDGKLHIRIRTDRTSVEGYTAFWMNVDSGENTNILLKQVDYSPLEWFVYEDNTYWYEYVLDYTPEDLEKISLTFNALYNGKTLTDDWTVSFPLNSIRTESKAAEKSEAEKKADEWRTPLLDRVDEFFTAWQNGDTESMLAMCGAHWRDQQEILVRILDNRVPESWKVSEIRGLQTPVATVGIDIHMQPEETNGVYLVKMKRKRMASGILNRTDCMLLQILISSCCLERCRMRKSS